LNGPIKAKQSQLVLTKFIKQTKLKTMKQIFTLLICVGAFTTSFAQYRSGHDNGRYAYDQKNHFDRSHFESRDLQIEKINREFDFKINTIQHDWRLRRHQKKVAIRDLERERARQIQIVNARFRDWKRDHDDYWHGR
jgi:hypothetical protein